MLQSADLTELSKLLTGSARAEILAGLEAAKGGVLAGLRAAMARHAFGLGGERVNLQSIVARLDAQCRKEGLHLTQAWDFGAQRFTDDPIPVLLLDYCLRLKHRKSDDRATAGIILDQYFAMVLSLLAVRAWDEGDANANLDRVSELLAQLHGPGGSGFQYVDDAESLMFLAISYFHPQEVAYDTLLSRVEQLDESHQLRVAMACGGMMSAHLRWGLRFMYQRDVKRMRDDNVADYPWLTHAVNTLAREYDKAGGAQLKRDVIAEALIVALAADPWHYTPVMSSRRERLMADCERLRAATGSFSPLSFTSNFPTNAAVALAAVAVEDGERYPSLNALFARGTSDAAASRLAERLMKYAASDPSRLGAGGAPLAVHDPRDGASALSALMTELKKLP